MKDSSEHQEWKETRSQDSRDGRIHEKEMFKKKCLKRIYQVSTAQVSSRCSGILMAVRES